MSTQPFRIELADDHHIVGDAQDGSGPSYVFLHGLGSVRTGEKSESLREHAQSRGNAFMRFDLRGHGDSTGQLGRVPVSELISDTVRVLEQYGPAILVGSSLGGLVGAHVAAERSDLVHKLVLLAPAFGLMPKLSQRVDEDGCLMTGEGVKFYVEPDVLKDAEQLDEGSLPARIQVPTLIVHGTADDVIPQIVSEMFFAAMTTEQKQLWIVPDGDHRLNPFASEIWQRIDAQPTS
ncbi:MAG: pimeloyl-ACP methyl ester carboxylesterase [Planctomycetota bacterium]